MRSWPARASCVRGRWSSGPADRAGDPRAGGVRRLRGDLEGAQHAAHAADERHERDSRHRRARRPTADRRGRRGAQRHPADGRDHLRHDQCRRRLPGHRPDARHVQREEAGSQKMSRNDVIDLLYIVAFSMFITGLHMLRGPRTAVRGNQVAAVGMAIAVFATLLKPGVGDWVLIVIGVAIGTAIGVPAARNVKMTAMPQMVALFNGVGGGAVALISVVEFRSADGDIPAETLIPLLFAAIIGSISFWGSNIAFLKLQELMKGGFKTPKAVNAGLLLIAVGLAVVIAAGS